MGTCWPEELLIPSTVALVPIERQLSCNWANMVAREMFCSSPHLSDVVNRRIVQSEIEGGVHLGALPTGAVLEVETENRSYTIEYRGFNQALISGHPVFCPRPTLVTISGSTWGGSMIKSGFIGRGMRLEFRCPEAEPITTSIVREVRSAQARP